MKSKKLGTVKVEYKGGQIWADWWVFTRGGSKSPDSFYLKYGKCWLSPIEQRLRCVMDLNSAAPIMKYLYRDCRMVDLLHHSNPLLEPVKKVP